MNGVIWVTDGGNDVRMLQFRFTDKAIIDNCGSLSLSLASLCCRKSTLGRIQFGGDLLSICYFREFWPNLLRQQER